MCEKCKGAYGFDPATCQDPAWLRQKAENARLLQERMQSRRIAERNAIEKKRVYVIYDCQNDGYSANGRSFVRGCIPEPSRWLTKAMAERKVGRHQVVTIEQARTLGAVYIV